MTDRQSAGLDLYGGEVRVGAIVAYNWSGNIAVGEVLRITRSGVIHIARHANRLNRAWPGGQFLSISKVKGGPSCCLVLRDPDGRRP